MGQGWVLGCAHCPCLLIKHYTRWLHTKRLHRITKGISSLLLTSCFTLPVTTISFCRMTLSWLQRSCHQMNTEVFTVFDYLHNGVVPTGNAHFSDLHSLWFHRCVFCMLKHITEVIQNNGLTFTLIFLALINSISAILMIFLGWDAASVSGLSAYPLFHDTVLSSAPFH